MGNKIFDALLEEKIDTFKNLFENTSRSVFVDEKTKKLFHTGEFGTYRELVSKEFLKSFIPRKLDIGTGFVISPNDKSTQCDLIIYDSSITPFLQSNELQRFYPVETVVGIGEIKSVMTKAQLKQAINKLAKVKKMKSEVPNATIFPDSEFKYNSKNNPYDNIFTFIICQKFDFDVLKIDMNELYSKGVKYWHRHNLILSIEDGLLLYNLPQDNKNVPFPYPFLEDEKTNKYVKYNPNNKYFHFKAFVKYIYDGLANATILYPEIVYYLTGFTPIPNIMAGRGVLEQKNKLGGH